MKRITSAALAATLLATPAVAGNGHWQATGNAVTVHNGWHGAGWHGGGWCCRGGWAWYNNGWVWAGIAGAALGAAALATVPAYSWPGVYGYPYAYRYPYASYPACGLYRPHLVWTGYQWAAC